MSSSLHPRSIPCAVVVVTLLMPHVSVAAPAGSPQWSPDGSAEAAALTARASARGRDELAATVGTRGVTYEKNVFTVDATDASGGGSADASSDVSGGTAVGPELPPDRPEDDASIDVDDMRRSAELERIAKRGRSFFIPGIVFSTLGTIFVIGGIAGMAKSANGATIGITVGAVGFAAIGYPLMFAGVRMRKHPEKYLDRRAQARIAPTGISLRF